MISHRRVRPLSSLGWSLAGGLALSLSLPPVGFYPLAWVALVPIIARWADRKASLALAREIYAIFLVAAAATGFWALHLPNELQSALAGLALLLVPIPIAVALTGAAWVRQTFGLPLGLGALAVNVLVAEFLVLHFPVGTPWTLLGHTQALALPFIQTVEVGGVLLLSAWVLGLNISAFLALEAMSKRKRNASWTDRGLAVASFAALIALPALYGTVRTSGDNVPPGHIEVAIVQPDFTPEQWDNPVDEDRVTHLASVSDALLTDWIASDEGRSRAGYSTTAPRPDLLIWPRASLPVYGDLAREHELYTRLAQWTTRRRTPLLTGAYTAATDEGRGEPDSRYYPLPMSQSAQSALLFQPSKEGPVRYDQARRVPVLEAVPSPIARSVGDAVPAFELGSRRALLPAGRTFLAASVGYEGVFGDHVRQFVGDGANLLVSLAPPGGGLAGQRQHLAFMRLRALETGRAIVVAAPSRGSALVLPDGRATGLYPTTVEEGLRVEAPIYTGRTPYVRWGDWVGQLAFVIGLVGNVGLFMVAKNRAKKPKKKRRVRHIGTPTAAG
ncbi:MAG: apolipoprotein N-acyltransferase [Bacteroidota bacterium]